MDVEPGDFVEEELMDGVEPLEPGNNQSSNLVVVCEICGALRSEFSTALLFREHYKKHSNPSEKYPDCTKVCGTKFQVLKHRLQVHQSKPKCTVCKKEFGNKGNLKEHMGQHENTALVTCDICKKVYSCKRTLKVHMKKEHSDDSLPKVKCNDCQKTFSHASSLLSLIHI